LLIEDLIKSYHIEEKVTLKVEIDELDIGLKTLVPLGLIINEIMSNSMKHAFNDSGGVISVEIRNLETNRFEMIIGDDGKGLAGVVESTGFGHELIEIFTEQLNGEIQQLDRQGTFYHLVFESLEDAQ